MLRKIQRSQRESALDVHRTVTVGPFLATFDAASDHPHRNYAVLASDRAPTAGEVGALRDLYRSRGLLPRLELLGPPPEAVTALTDGGFHVTEELAMMALENDLQPRTAEGVEVVIASDRDAFAACARVQNAAYGEGEPADSDVDRLAATAARGGWVALARLAGGTPVGSGLADRPLNGLSVIAAVGVLDGHRGLGIASAVATQLAQSVLAAGARPWLECEDANEERLYGALGFTRVGSELVLTAA